MNRVYTRRNFKNFPSTDTPLNETNMNAIDLAVYTIDGRVIDLDTTKLNLSTAQTMVKDVSYNESNGVFTITYLNGTKITLDTKLEKLAVNFEYDSTNEQLVITLSDGTKQYVDLKSLITQYDFVNSSQITFTVDNGKVTALIVEGSITEAMLQPNFLADCKAERERAEQAASNAYQSEVNAKASEVLAKGYAESIDSSNFSVNLIKPTLTSITTKGIICTSNGDGTYTLNGTASSTAWIKLQSALALKAGTYRLIGTPSNTPSTSSYTYYTNGTTNFAIDRGSGATFTLANDTTADVYLQAFAGDAFNNIVFKPMLTTDLTATYDSFVPYTGNGGRLNADVAEIRKEIDNVTPIPITFKPEASPTATYTDCKKIGNVVYIQTMFSFTASDNNQKIIGTIPAEYVKTARLMLSACHNNATCIPVVIRPTTGELEFWLNRPAGTTYGYTLTGSYTLN